MPATARPLPDAPRVLIVRLSAIGDVLMASPVAQAIKEARPNAHISWAVEKQAAPLVRANPCVDEVIEVPALRSLREMPAFVTAVKSLLAGHVFDVALDCQGLLRSGLVISASGAPRRIRPSSGEMPWAFATERATLPPVQSISRLAEGYLTMLTVLDIPVVPRRILCAVPAQDRAASHAFLKGKGIEGGDKPRPYLACCISSTRPQKDWPLARWGELADRIWSEGGLRTVLVGGPERRADTLHLVKGCASSPIVATGETSLLASAALVQDAAVVVGVDTGLTYVGLATDTPTVALYGSTPSEWLRDEPFATIVQHHYPCAPCHRHPVCNNFDCMDAITVEEVAAIAQAVRAPHPPER